MSKISTGRRRSIVWALRLLILAAVVIGVRGTFQSAVDRLAEHEWTLRPAWLVASGVFYILGLGAMAWFWRHALAAFDQAVPWPEMLRAYYIGHLGKYVPGKALVVVLRVGGIRQSIRSIWLAVVSTLMESMLMMAVGAAIAAALVTTIVPRPVLLPLAILAAALCFLPTLPPIARRIAHFGLRRFRAPKAISSGAEPTTEEVHQAVDRFTWPLWASGCFFSVACWCLLALSLWATLRGIGVDQLQPTTDGALLIGAVTLAVVAGFLSFLPGGLVVRDALLMQALAPSCGEADAFVAALLLRLVWLVSELVACGILYGATLRPRSA